MIPRAASEQLVAAAAELCLGRPARVADVGTGSGAIAVSLAVADPQSEIWATDVSAAAVSLGRANARRVGVSDRVHVVRGNLLEPLPGEFDLVVANLPYLPRSDHDGHPNLVAEPEDAVFADGDGLDPYRSLLRSAEERLTPSGGVVIQLHRRVIVAAREDLTALRASLPDLVPDRPLLRAVA